MEYTISPTQSFSAVSPAIVRTTSKDVFWAFLTITATGMILVYAMQYLLISDELYFNSLTEKFTAERIQQSIEQSHRLAWVVYAIMPLSNLIRFGCVASCLSLGYFFLTNRWSFRPFLWVAIQAELVLLLPPLLKITWFLLVQPHYSLDDLQNFFPLSLASAVNYSALEAWLRYPSQVLSLFEVAYWFALAYGIKKVCSLPIGQSLRLVASSYGAAMVLWVTFTMFLVVSFI